MGYIGGELLDLFPEGPTLRAGHRMADTGGDRMTDMVVNTTPIDSGNLRTSWYQKPVRVGAKGGRFTWESGVETEIEYAPYVEHGTGLWGPKKRKYEIKPKRPGGVLAFRGRTGGFSSMMTPEVGGTIFTRKVMHPGSPGAHMVASAAALLEATFENTLRGDMKLWEKEYESIRVTVR